jgi:hypothetical protein
MSNSSRSGVAYGLWKRRIIFDTGLESIVGRLALSDPDTIGYQYFKGESVTERVRRYTSATAIEIGVRGHPRRSDATIRTR